MNSFILSFLHSLLILVAVTIIDENIYFYIVGFVVIVLVKIALLWDGQGSVNFKSVFVLFALSLGGGYVGYLVGFEYFKDRVILRTLILLGFVYLGDVLLVSLRASFPKAFEKLMMGVSSAMLKKIGGTTEPDDIDKKNEDFSEEP